jgi:hypothetical protein
MRISGVRIPGVWIRSILIPASWLSLVTVSGLHRIAAGVPGTGVPGAGVPGRAGIAASGAALVAVPGASVPGAAESLLSAAERLRTLTSVPVSLGTVSLGGAIPLGAVLLGTVSLSAVPCCATAARSGHTARILAVTTTSVGPVPGRAV